METHDVKVVNSCFLVPASERPARPGTRGPGRKRLSLRLRRAAKTLPTPRCLQQFPAAIKQKLRLLLFVIPGASRGARCHWEGKQRSALGLAVIRKTPLLALPSTRTFSAAASPPPPLTVRSRGGPPRPGVWGAPEAGSLLGVAGGGSGRRLFAGTEESLRQGQGRRRGGGGGEGGSL